MQTFEASSTSLAGMKAYFALGIKFEKERKELFLFILN
jgi:hypothetical protein